MKLLILLLTPLMLTSCFSRNADLKPGDCATIEYKKDEREAWETKGPGYVFRVIEIGKQNYRVYQVNLETKTGFETNVGIKDYERTDVYTPVSCAEATKLIEGAK